MQERVAGRGCEEEERGAMNAIKDRVSKTVSRLFSRSQSARLDQELQASPCSKLHKHASFSFLSSSTSVDRNSNNENIEPNSARSIGSGDECFENAHDSGGLDKLMPSLSNESVFICPNLYNFFQASLPKIIKGCQWILLYSTARNGISLQTLIRKSADVSGPCLLITGDKQGAIFGGLLEAPLKPTAKLKYQGTHQTFVFTTVHGEPRLFRPTGVNRYFFLCLKDLLALGGGKNFALCINGDLLSGTSGPCDTFGNTCLANNQEFELKDVELWGFRYVSQYLK